MLSSALTRGIMDIHLQAARAGEIALSPELPASLLPLQAPDSICFGAAGPFGHVLFQELDGEGISIRHSILYFEEEDELFYRSEEPALRLQVVLNNSYYSEAEGLGEIVLHERGFSLNYVPFVHQRLEMHARDSYTHLSLYYRPEDLGALQNSFPGLPEFLQKVRAGEPSLFNLHYCIARGAMMALVNNILECPYTGMVRRLYLNSLSMEILVLALVRIAENQDKPPPPAVGREEAERVYAAKAKVLTRIEENVTLPMLAELTGQSPYKMNKDWKSIYGIGAMEWVHETRMEIAHHQLQDLKLPLIKVARASGYTTVTAFTLAFKNYFGYNPGFTRKSDPI
ncbi:MAG TPA: helix-turn-helix transcriptional regulator [Puia sp.]|nr:helix-turn-helix transcriptional regulator [Puia sp.]